MILNFYKYNVSSRLKARFVNNCSVRLEAKCVSMVARNLSNGHAVAFSGAPRLHEVAQEDISSELTIENFHGPGYIIRIVLYMNS